MELIVAVYADWGIGCSGTQPIALSADRKFFRETTKGCMVIAGRRTVEDFPGRKPLPGRENVLLTRRGGLYPGFTLCDSVERLSASFALLRESLRHKIEHGREMRHLVSGPGQ